MLLRCTTIFRYDSCMEWKVDRTLIDYPEALSEMEARVTEIHTGTAEELIWFLEHPSLYTAGTSAKTSGLLEARFPVHKTGRGGEYTYHGPGQRIAYVMLNLKKRQRAPDVKAYVCALEQWVIDTLAEFDIKGERRDGRIGIWVDMARYGSVGDKKIAAIGVRIRHWITFHGVAINVNPNLSHFGGIVPCGISDAGVTSFEELGVDVTMDELDKALKKKLATHF